MTRVCLDIARVYVWILDMTCVCFVTGDETKALSSPRIRGDSPVTRVKHINSTHDASHACPSVSTRVFSLSHGVLEGNTWYCFV